MSRDRLTSLLRVRTLLERRARGGLAEGERDVVAARAGLARARQVQRARPQPPPVLSPLALRALQLQGLAAHELVEAALGEQDAAVHHRDDLYRAWSHASIRRKSVERLTERRELEHARAAEHAASRALDELVLQRRERR